MIFAGRRTRGHYALTFAASMVVLLALGGLAVDVAWVLRVRSEAQFSADAAARAAVITLRRTGEIDVAEDAARAVAEANHLGGDAPSSVSVVFGAWDDRDDEPVFDRFATAPNAARVTVGRTGTGTVTVWLARAVGRDDFDVRASAIAATRSTHYAVALDASPTWSEVDFLALSDALDAFRDRIDNAPAPGDEVSVSTYHSRFGWLVIPPMVPARDPVELGESFAVLAPSSRAGHNPSPVDGLDCVPHTGALVDDFTTPPGGCFPAMPRAYADETGVDPSPALRQLRSVLWSAQRPASRRVLVLVAGHPLAPVAPDAGEAREAAAKAGDVDARFSRVVSAAGRSEEAIRQDARLTTDDLWTEFGVHTSVVVLGVDDPFWYDLAHGAGRVTASPDVDTVTQALVALVDHAPVGLVR